MAIGTPSQLATQSSTAAVTSAALVLGSGIAANTLVVVACYHHNSSDTGSGFSTSVADDHGNTYTLVQQADRTGHTIFTELYYFFYSSAPGATTVTSNFVSSNRTAHRAWSVSGITTTAAQLDKAGTGSGLSTGPTVTASGANTQNDEIVFVAVGDENSGTDPLTAVWPPNTGYTTLGVQIDTVRSGDTGYAYKIVSAGETSSASFTFGGSLSWAFVLGTFKADLGGSSSTPTIPILTVAAHR